MKFMPLLILPLLGCPALADVLHLKDGTQLEGTLRRESSGWVVTDASGKTTTVGDDVVARIEKVGSRTSVPMAVAGLGSLRRAMENVTDPKLAIDRYGRFIEQNKQAPAAEEARKDLAVWKDRFERKMVKIGATWITPQQRQALLEQSVGLLEQACELIKQERLGDAEAIVTQVLALDADNASGLYLRGLLAFRQGRYAQAKECYERLRQVLPNHGPSLNNLAILFWHHRQYVGAMTFYDQAMAAAPKTRQILDNVAESLSMLSPTERKSAPARRAAQQFSEQDARLQEDLAKEGLIRWGGTYISQERMKELEKVRQRVEEKLQALRSEGEKTEERMRRIDSAIAANERSMSALAEDRSYVDENGKLRKLPMPPVYYDLQRENEVLVEEHRALAAKLGTFNDRARAIQQELPVPLYTGQLKIIDVEGMPLVAALPKAAARPATMPATQSAAQSIASPGGAN